MNEENVQPAEALLERGRLLLMNNRPADAERFLRECLSQDPTNVSALHLLAVCLQSADKREREALEVIDRAIGLEPEWSALHTRRSMILSSLQRTKEARIAAQTAITLSPEDSAAHAAHAYSYLGEARWAEAEAGARTALTFDADDTLAQNVLSQSLVFQKKTAASQADVAARLSRNPEDPFTHYNAGYAALREGDYRKAEGHFLEALRLDASFDAAREGLLESFRARNAFYRGYLRYTFAMTRLSERTRMTVIVGGYLVYRFGVQMLKGVSPVLASILILAYFLFATWTFVARGVGNLLILADRRARQALRRRELLEGLLVGGGVVIGLPLLLFGLVVDNWIYVFVGGAFVIPAIPLALFLRAKARTMQFVYGAAAGVVILCAAGVVTALAAPNLFSMTAFRVMLQTAGWTVLGATVISSFVPNRE